MKILKLILENKAEDFKTKFGGKFDEVQINKILDNIPQKYWDWVGKNFDVINFDSNFQPLTEYLKQFDKLSSNLPKTDINSYKSVDELWNALNEYSKRPRRDYKKVEGGNVIYDDGNLFIVNPQTYQSSCYYGKGTKWCTASETDNAFTQHNSDGKLFYILDRSKQTSDPFYKVALLQKFNGEQSFWDARDSSTKIYPAVVGESKYKDIMNKISEYMQSEYAEQIKIWSDKESAKKERERLERLRIQRIQRMRESEAEQRREDNEWELGPDCPEEGLRAHALLNWLESNVDVDVRTPEDVSKLFDLRTKLEELEEQRDNLENQDEDTSDIIDEIDSIEEEISEIESKVDVYNIVPTGTHYDMTEFEVLAPRLEGRRYAVGDEDDTKSSAEIAVKNLIDDIGYGGFNKSFLWDHVDTDGIRDKAVDIYDEDVRNNPESYLNEEQRGLSYKQEDTIQANERKIEQLNHNLEKYNEILDELDDFEQTEKIEARISEIEDEIEKLKDEIEEIKDSPDGDFPDEVIDEKVEELADDAANNAEYFLDEMGLDIEDFIDQDDFIESVIDSDGYGPTLNSYDGDADEMQVEGKTYWVMRID